MAVAVAVAVLAPTRAHAFYGEEGDPLVIGGSFRSIGALTFNYDNDLLFAGDPADGISQSPLRLTIEGDPHEDLSFSVHGVQTFVFSTQAAGTGAGLGFGLPTGVTRYRALNLNWRQVDDPDMAMVLELDRFVLEYRTPWFTLHAGRQALSWGHAFLWSVLDEFIPFDPRQFDQSYKPGMDAAHVEVPLSDRASLELVGVFGRKLQPDLDPEPEGELAAVDFYGSALMARAFLSAGPVDVSVQGGKRYGAYTAGAGLTADLRGVGLRAEGVYVHAQDGSPRDPLTDGRLVVGHGGATAALEYYLMEYDLILQGQYFYNGAGAPHDLWLGYARVGYGESFSASAHLVGLTGQWTATPLLQLAVLLQVSGSDGSGLAQPLIRYSVSGESELVAGLAIPWGRRPTRDARVPESAPILPRLRSDLGTGPVSAFFEYKVYF